MLIHNFIKIIYIIIYTIETIQIIISYAKSNFTNYNKQLFIFLISNDF